MKRLSLSIRGCVSSAKDSFCTNPVLVDNVVYGYTPDIHDITYPDEFKLVRPGHKPQVQVYEKCIRISWFITGDVTKDTGNKSNGKSPQIVKCANCTRVLYSNETCKFKSLPSPFWSELVECWSCHRQEFASIAMEGGCFDQNGVVTLLPKDQFTVLYSNTDLVVRHANVQGDPNTGLKCLNCEYTLGTLINPQQVYNIPMTRVTVNNHHMTVNQYLIIMMMASMQAHSCFTFCIKSTNADHHLYCDLINWTSHVSRVNSSVLEPVLMLKRLECITTECETIIIPDEDWTHLALIEDDDHLLLFPS